MSAPKHKYDIFSVLDKISTKNTKFYASMSEDEQKAIQPLVVMRWLSGTTSARQIYFLNELVNPFVFPMNKHKQLLMHLMAISCAGSKQRYYWNKTQSKKSTNMPISVSVVRDYFGYNTIDAIDALALLDNNTVVDYAEQLGLQPDTIKTLNKELKTRTK